MLEMDGQVFLIFLFQNVAILQEITLDEFESALDKAYSKIRQILDAQDKLSAEIGVKKEKSHDINQVTDFLTKVITNLIQLG